MSETWVRAIEASALVDGLGGAVVGGHRVALYHVEGQYFATDDICTHGQALLSEGYLEDHLIECPLHQGQFDVRTGKAVSAPCSIPVRSYPVKLEDGVLFVALEPS